MASSNLRIGDSVNVPGQMYGTLKFVGPVQGKRGIFAGVQLAPEFAARGKNSGDVEGKHYFRTSVPGAGIFLPVDKAEKRYSGGSTTSTPGSLSNFNQGGRMPSAALPKPNFSQSVGPGNLAARTASPTALKPPGRRESLPRPSSPLRKVNNVPTSTTPAAGRLATPRTRPSLGFNRSTIGAPGTVASGTKSPATRQPSKFGHSLRQSVRGPGSITPSLLRQPPSSTASVTTSTTDDYSLGPEAAFDESPPQGSGDEVADHTPTPATRHSFKSRVEVKKHEDELRNLREQLEDRDRQLNDQSTSIAEMERSVQDLQNLIQNLDSAQIESRQLPPNDEDLPKDVQELRATLREKNEKIKAMTAEFDSNRADFRSTIDTLEMASTETERVYERRVEELLEEVKHLQERNEDVEGVAQQFRQLEELVAELEEGLEDARRGEAEARGEVEFLRGEVERGRSELRRERERNRAGDKLNGIDPDSNGIPSEELEELNLRLDQKDDEIRGLKAIIQNLNNTAAARTSDRDSKGPRMNGGAFAQGHSKTKSTNTVISVGTGEDTATHLQNQIRDLESLLQQKSTREEELREEVTKLRQSVQFGSKFVVPGLEEKRTRRNSNLGKHQSIQSSSTITAGRSSGGFGRKTDSANEFVDAEQFHVNDLDNSANRYNNRGIEGDGALNTAPKTPDAASVSAETEASSNALYCEICEEPGHDILTCGQMIGGTLPPKNNSLQTPKPAQRDSSRSFSGKDTFRRSHESQGPPPDTSAPPPPVGTARNSTTKAATGKRSSNSDVARPAPLSMSRQSSGVLPLKSPGLAPEALSPRKKSATPTTSPVEVKSSSGPTTTSTNTNTNTSSGLIEGTGDQAGMLAGKESGIIDPDKWCALCELDGHESVDCPIDSGF